MNFTRREFAKLGALSLAARFAPALNAQSPTGEPSAKKTGYAVIGLGRIAGHFMPGVLGTTNSRIGASSVDSGGALAERVLNFERAEVLKELERHSRHITQTAKALGLERSQDRKSTR